MRAIHFRPPHYKNPVAAKEVLGRMLKFSASVVGVSIKEDGSVCVAVSYLPVGDMNHLEIHWYVNKEHEKHVADLGTNDNRR